MSRVELAPEVADDFERILNHLAEHDAADPERRIRGIIEAINVLEHNPMIGRPTRRHTRELVIGRRSHGYVALYRYVPDLDIVYVLALRSQREAGYSERGQRRLDTSLTVVTLIARHREINEQTARGSIRRAQAWEKPKP